jgi:hypothetical protein
MMTLLSSTQIQISSQSRLSNFARHVSFRPFTVRTQTQLPAWQIFQLSNQNKCARQAQARARKTQQPVDPRSDFMI